MTESLVNRRILLASRPEGLPSVGNFTADSVPVPEPGDGQMLIRVIYASIDPAMRGWISDVPNYAPPVKLGAVMRGVTVGEVITSNHPDYTVGDIVCGRQGWQSYGISDGRDIALKIDPAEAPISAALGALGNTGMTAYVGMIDIGTPQDGETVVVSTAAGAVGSIAGQLARIRGARTVGIAGSDEKAALCVSDFGYERCINYKTEPDLSAALVEACPDGIDVYYDNVGGATLDAVLDHINVGARIAICGTISLPTGGARPMGPRIERTLLVKRARIQGFIVFDHVKRQDAILAALRGWYRDGRLTWREDILDGIDKAPEALVRLLEGRNKGKQLVRVGPEP